MKPDILIKVAQEEVEHFNFTIMTSKIKAMLHGVITLFGNGVIIGMVPDPYKVYAVLAFNLIQVIYAYFDTSYAVQLMGRNPANGIPNQ